jgi:hypothetical protein
MSYKHFSTIVRTIKKSPFLQQWSKPDLESKSKFTGDG